MESKNTNSLNSEAADPWDLHPPLFLISMSKRLAPRAVWEAAWGLVIEELFQGFCFSFKMKGSHCVVKMIQRNWCHFRSAFDEHMCALTLWAVFWLDASLTHGKKHFHMLSELDYCHWLPSDLTEHKGPWEHTLSFCDMSVDCFSGWKSSLSFSNHSFLHTHTNTHTHIHI